MTGRSKMTKRNEFLQWFQRYKHRASIGLFDQNRIIDAFNAGIRAGRRSERRKVEKLKAEIRDIYSDLFPDSDPAKIFRKLS